MWNKQRYCWQIQNNVWIQNFCMSNWKITMLGKSVYFFVVLWHGGSCQEMCGTILWVGEQDDSTTLQSINSLHWRIIISKKKNWNPWVNCQESALKLFSNVETWHELERPDILWSVVEHCEFSEAIRLFQSVGCVRNKLQFRTVQQSQKSFPWTQDWGWTENPHLIYGIWSLQFFRETRIRVIKNGETWVRTYVRFVQHLTNFNNERNLMEWWSGQCWFYFLIRQFSSGSFVVCVWRQRSSDQDDHKGKKPDNETCFQKPQICSWLVVR